MRCPGTTRAAAGDRETYHRLYLHFHARIFNFVFGLVRLKEEAEDITQDAFVQAFQNLQGLKNPERFEQWLYRIARNEVYQRFRKRKRVEIPLDDPLVTELAAVLERLQGKPPKIAAFGGWTDASLISNYGKIPTLVFGPGDLAVAHSPWEKVLVEELRLATLAYALLAAEICS